MHNMKQPYPNGHQNTAGEKFKTSALAISKFYMGAHFSSFAQHHGSQQRGM